MTGLTEPDPPPSSAALFSPSLFPVVFFPYPDQGARPQEFLTALWTNIGVPAGAQATILAGGLGAQMEEDADLPLLDVDAALAAAPPQARSTLAIQRGAVRRAMLPYVPLLDGETFVSATVGCLAQDHAGLTAGTVVVTHVTSATTRYLALPLVQADPAASTAGSLLSQVRAQTVVAAPAAIVEATDTVSILDGVLNIIGVLGFALPQPWGALVMGVTSLFEMLLGLGNDRPDPFAQVVLALENYLQARDVTGWGRTINNFISGPNGLDTQIEVLKDTQSNDSTVYINTTLLKFINDATEASSSDNVNGAAAGLHDTVNGIVNGITGSGSEWYYQHRAVPLDDTLDLALLGVTSLLMALKMKIQLYATLANLAKGHGDTEGFNEYTAAWLDAYAVYKLNATGDGVDTHGYVGSMTDLVAKAESARLSLVTGPYAVGQLTKPFKSNQYVFVESGWGFLDGYVEDPNLQNPSPWGVYPPQHYQPDRVDTQTGCCVTTETDDPGAAESKVAGQQQAYVANLTAEYDKRKQVVAKWAASIDEWNAAMPPQSPTGSPTVAADAVWTASTPQGPNWISGNTVSYAMAYANGHGPSPYGPWSDPTPVTDKAYPTVSVPTDPLGIATARHIFRRFGTTNTTEGVYVIADNTTLSFVDKTD